jgi:hypothetical protein
MAWRIGRLEDAASEVAAARAVHDNPVRLIFGHFGFQLPAPAVLQIERVHVTEQSHCLHYDDSNAVAAPEYLS